MATCPELDPAATLQFVINAAAGSSDAEAKREVIEAALRAGGRHGELLFCGTAELSGVAQQAAAQAIANRTALVAVGGDGTLNTVAQAAHAVGCVMGVIPYGTFNYFARTHGISIEPAAAARSVLDARPMPVQVAAINDRVFLVNASWVSTPNSCGTAKPTRPASAAAARWRSWRPVRRSCAHSAGSDCTSRWVARFARCRP